MHARVSTAIVAAALLSVLPRSGAAACGDPGAVAAAGARIAIDCDCAAATNHGRYVRCARMVALAIPVAPECIDDVVRCAARSTCGKPGAVACCRTDRTGRTRCSIKRSADRCRAPHGGNACASMFASCCNACGTGGCATTTTTTVTVTFTTTTSTLPCGTGSASGCCLGDYDSQPGSTPPGTCAVEVGGPDCSVHVFHADCVNRAFTWLDTRCPDPLCGEATGCCANVQFAPGASIGTFGAPLDPETAAQGAAACQLPQIGGTPLPGRCP